MKIASLLVFLIPVVAAVQSSSQDPTGRGAEVFSAFCTAYCHAPAGGSGGGAPRLAARGFDEAYIRATIANGVPGTPMPAFSLTLPRADLEAVVAYVASLNGLAGGATTDASSERPSLASEAELGRQLFSDAVRGFGRCSTCHEVNGIGIPITTAIAEVPGDIPTLRRLATPHVVTAWLDGGTMPALVVSNASRAAIFYDLTASPPVLRTEAPGSVRFTDGSSWQHSSALRSYADRELELILAYLRAAIAR